MKPKITFILDHQLQHYRIPLFVNLNKYFSITVVHRGPYINNCEFQQVVLDYVKKGPFEYIKKLRTEKNTTAVVFMQNLRILNIYLAPLTNRQIKYLMWGIGTSSSKGLGNEKRPSIFVRNAVSLLYQGIALYSKIPLNLYWQRNSRKIEIVGNSIENLDSEDLSSHEKSYFLFIGSLHKRKGLSDLIDAIKETSKSYPKIKLVIAGDGPEKEKISNKISQLHLNKHIKMVGSITEPHEKKELFSRAYAVISPYQAGLSVVDTFSYGIPFITSSEAITGGETASILNGFNGILFDNIEQLPTILSAILSNKISYAELGHNAYSYYMEHLDFKLYTQRFRNFINKHIAQ